MRLSSYGAEIYRNGVERVISAAAVFVPAMAISAGVLTMSLTLYMQACSNPNKTARTKKALIYATISFQAALLSLYSIFQNSYYGVMASLGFSTVSILGGLMNVKTMAQPDIIATEPKVSENKKIKPRK